MPPPPVWGATVGNDGVCDALGAAYVNEVDGAGFALAELGDAEARGEAGADADVAVEAEADAEARAGDEAAALLPGLDADPDGVKIAGCVGGGEAA